MQGIDIQSILLFSHTVTLPNAADQGSFRRFENEKNKTKKFEHIPTKKRIERKATCSI